MEIFNDFYKTRMQALHEYSDNLQIALDRGEYSFILRKEYKGEHKAVQKEIALLKWIKSELDIHQKKNVKNIHLTNYNIQEKFISLIKCPFYQRLTPLRKVLAKEEFCNCPNNDIFISKYYCVF
jgi:hypothetical protein